MRVDDADEEEDSDAEELSLAERLMRKTKGAASKVAEEISLLSPEPPPPPLPQPQQAPPGKRAAAPYPALDAENRAPQQPAATQAITAALGTAAQAIAAAAVPEAPQRDEFEKCIVRGAA